MLQCEQQDSEQAITEIKIDDDGKFQISRHGFKIIIVAELEELEHKTANDIFYIERNISGNELDELNGITIEPKSSLLQQSDHNNLTGEGIQRIDVGKHDMV